MLDKITLTVEEVGKRLGISRATAYKLVERPDFPTLRIGRRIVIPVDGLNEWVRTNTQNQEVV